MKKEVVLGRHRSGSGIVIIPMAMNLCSAPNSRS